MSIKEPSCFKSQPGPQQQAENCCCDCPFEVRCRVGVRTDALSADAQEWLQRIVQQIGEGVAYDRNDALRAECASAGLLTVGRRGAVLIEGDVMDLVYTQNYLAY